MTATTGTSPALSIRAILLTSIAALLPLSPASAEEASEAEDETVRSSREIVVQADIGYRNRSEDAEPVLTYGEDYFQRFEPLTAGDALKRVPSVTFLSDVIESDGARLRGLDPGYTQILINGEKVPGSQADRSFFLDRIPAELVKQVEIVRSSSARRTADAVAGTLNIVLRDAFTMDGGYVRGGALLFDDGKVKPTGGLYYGGELGPGRILLGVNVQGRYNPKQKKSLRYGDSPENNPNYATDDFDNREDQSDIRNGTDYAANMSYAIEGESTQFELSGSFVRTERTEDERSFEYNDPTAINGPVRTVVNPGNLLTDNANVNDITQESWNVAAKLKQEWSMGETTLRASFARFQDRQDEFENEVDFDRSTPRFTGDLIAQQIQDDEFALGLEHAFPIGDTTKIVIGGFAQNKERDTSIAEGRDRYNLTAADREGYDQFSEDPNQFVRTPPALIALPGGLNTIEEDRRDLFALVEGKNGALTWEAGVRWENTKLRIDDQTVASALATSTAKYDFLLPSASLKYDLGRGRITASAARTMRRPRLDYLSPALLEEELGDNDLLGNPNLRPETAWGGDLGYEHRIGSRGVIGVNVFYRKVKNLVEIVNTGVAGSADDPDDDPIVNVFVLQPQNVGSGKVWGVEFDLSASLGFIGLPDTGVFGNLGLINSSITDFGGKRRFNGQSEYVYNAGFIQNVPSVGVAFGATYRKQGAAFDRIVGEEIRTTYGADLEVFVEKRFGKNLTIRAVGSNLLDGSKDEAFNKFTTIEDQLGRSFDEYELETETAGPVFQVIVRYAF
jgi:iron complex outermembrane receptor protein